MIARKIFLAILAVAVNSVANQVPAFASDETGSDAKDTKSNAHSVGTQDRATMKLYRNRIASEPENALLHHEFGAFLTDKGVEKDEALLHLRKSVELEPQNERFKVSLFRALVKFKDYARAVKYQKEWGWSAPPPVGDFYPSRVRYPVYDKIKSQEKSPGN